MMTSPDQFYDWYLKGKTAEEIMSVIRKEKREIGRLKNIMEHPNYADRIKYRPSEDVQIACSRLYLSEAKRALEEAGGTYVPSAAEQKAMAFDDNIPHIKKIEFCIGGFFGGYETKTFTIDGDKVRVYTEHSLRLTPTNADDVELPEIDKEEFFNALEELHIGEWRRKYDCRRFGVFVMDGTQWHLDIYFSNGHRPVKFYGDNAYPYNFDRLLELFDIEE